MVLPCRHVCVCSVCAAELDRCPICRGPADRTTTYEGLGERESELRTDDTALGVCSKEADEPAQNLPYNGDIQAAMRAQDRPAIRAIMENRRPVTEKAAQQDQAAD